MVIETYRLPYSFIFPFLVDLFVHKCGQGMASQDSGHKVAQQWRTSRKVRAVLIVTLEHYSVILWPPCFPFSKVEFRRINKYVIVWGLSSIKLYQEKRHVMQQTYCFSMKLTYDINHITLYCKKWQLGYSILQRYITNIVSRCCITLNCTQQSFTQSEFLLKGTW